VASWSSIDYYGNWKALHYETARQYRNLIIACDTFCHQGTNIYVVNDNLSAISGDCLLQLVDFQGNLLNSETKAFTAQANSSTFFTHYQLAPQYESQKENCFLRIIFKDNRNNILAEKVHFFLYPNALQLKSCRVSLPSSQPHRDLQTGLNLIRETDTTRTYILTLHAPHLQYGVAIEANVPCRFSDNYFLLLPNEEKKITLTATCSKTDAVRFEIRSFGESGRYR
jgi:beta-mannosidase